MKAIFCFELFDFLPVRLIDVVDIILVAILIYQLYKLVRGTVAIRIFFGILAIYLVWQLVKALKMALLSQILGQFIGVGVIALIIVFQQEIRRFLLMIGTTGVLGKIGDKQFLRNVRKGARSSKVFNIDAIMDAARDMAKTKTGALIVLVRSNDLNLYNNLGEQIDAQLSSNMVKTIFFKNNPMHDGAIIVSNNNKIISAKCVLPVSDTTDIPDNLGLRHRAGIGITERSAAMALIVSEESGKLALAHNGKIDLGIHEDEIRDRIEQFMS